MNRPDLASKAQAAEFPGAPLLAPVPDPSPLTRAVRPWSQHAARAARLDRYGPGSAPTPPGPAPPSEPLHSHEERNLVMPHEPSDSCPPARSNGWPT